MVILFESFFGDSQDMRVNAEACRILNAIQRMERVAKVNYLSSYFGGAVEVDVELPFSTEIQWPYAVVRKNAMSIWFIGGAPTTAITKAIIDDFAAAASLDFRYNVPKRAINYGIQILGDPSYRKFEGQDRHRYFCWSYGGVIASYISQRCPTAPPAPGQHIISYGQPRGVTEDYRLTRRCQHTRWWMPEDIVPAMPPHQSEAPGTNTLFWGFLRGGHANFFVHPEYGMRLNGDGSIVPYSETSPYWTGRTFPLSPVEAWWSSNDISHGHNLGLYENAFLLGVQLVQPPTPAPPAPPRPEQPDTIRSRERPAIVERAAAEIRAELSQPQSLVRDYLFTDILPNAHNPFRARVTDGTWFVLKGDNVIDVGPGKRIAKRLARRYNKAARGK